MFPYRGHLHYPLIHSLRYLISSHYHFLFSSCPPIPKVWALVLPSTTTVMDGSLTQQSLGDTVTDVLPYRPGSHAVHAIDCRLRDLPLDSSECATAPTPFGICTHTLSMARIVTPSGHPQCGRLSDYPPMRGRRQQPTVFSGPRRTYHINDQLFFLAWTSQGSARAVFFFTTPTLRLQTRAYLSDASTTMIRKRKTSSCQDH